jgi:hypothetical protein
MIIKTSEVTITCIMYSTVHYIFTVYLLYTSLHTLYSTVQYIYNYSQFMLLSNSQF